MMECLTTTIGYETIESAYMYVLANLFTYSEALVIRTSIIWILDYPDHKITYLARDTWIMQLSHQRTYTVCTISVARMFSLLEDGGVYLRTLLEFLQK